MTQTNILVPCDRCGNTVEGLVCSFNHLGKLTTITGNFYDVSEGSWSYFAQDGEKKICDACMHADPEYTRMYGKIPKTS